MRGGRIGVQMNADVHCFQTAVALCQLKYAALANRGALQGIGPDGTLKGLVHDRQGTGAKF